MSSVTFSQGQYYNKLLKIDYPIDDLRKIIDDIGGKIHLALENTIPPKLKDLYLFFILDLMTNLYDDEKLFSEIISFIGDLNEDDYESSHLGFQTLDNFDALMESKLADPNLSPSTTFRISQIHNKQSLLKKRDDITRFNRTNRVRLPMTLHQMARQFYYMCIALRNHIDFCTNKSAGVMVSLYDTINRMDQTKNRLSKRGKIMLFDGLSHQPIEMLEDLYDYADIPYDNNVVPFVHNFGNAKYPCGGYLKGTTAQEEELCRLFGNLSGSLYRATDKYGNNIVKDGEYICGNFYSGRNACSVILSQNIVMSCTLSEYSNETVKYEFLQEHNVKCGIVTSFASDNRFTIQSNEDNIVLSKRTFINFLKLIFGYLLCFYVFIMEIIMPSYMPQIRRTNEKKFATEDDFRNAFKNTFCAPAVHANATCIVIGAWGTGVFKNDGVDMMENIMLPVIKKYRNLYDLIIFCAPENAQNKDMFDTIKQFCEDDSTY